MMLTFYADDTTIYSNCNPASDLGKQLELASELESGLQENVDWGRKWLVDFSAGKCQRKSFDQFNNSGDVDVKIDGSVLEEKLCFKMLDCLSLLNWIGAITFSLLLKSPPRKWEP